MDDQAGPSSFAAKTQDVPHLRDSLFIVEVTFTCFCHLTVNKCKLTAVDTTAAYKTILLLNGGLKSFRADTYKPA